MTDRISVRRSFYRAGLQAFQGTCTVCGAPFLTGYEATLYCSDACRQKAHRQRQAQQSAEVPARRRRRQSTLLVDQQLALPTTSTQGDGYESRDWQGTPIQRRASDGWVNATAMCQAGGKRWNDYIRLDRTQEYIAALEASVTAESPCAAAVAGNPATGLHGSTGNPADLHHLLIEVIRGGRPELQGTWIHPRLAVDLARWISPAFAVWMDGWFLESMQQPARPPLPTCATAPTPLPAPLRQGHRIHIEADSDAEAAEVFLGAVMYYLRITVGILEPAHAWPDRYSLPYRRIV